MPSERKRVGVFTPSHEWRRVLPHRFDGRFNDLHGLVLLHPCIPPQILLFQFKRCGRVTIFRIAAFLLIAILNVEMEKISKMSFTRKTSITHF
jgi:hypothetical protein